MNAPATFATAARAPEPGRLAAPEPPRGSPLPAFAALIVLGLLLLLANPAGYRGGGLDDFHYLEAARCAAANGVCLADTHWAARMPLVLPLAAAIGLLGESRASVALAPFLYALAATALLVRLVAAREGARAGALAGIALLATPAFGGSLLDPNIDIPELACLLAALAALQEALRPPARAARPACAGRDARAGPWSIVAGAAMALALQSRPSALCALLLLLALMTAHAPARRLLPLFLTGLAMPLLAEAAAYALAAGDPLLPWRLALGHARIPSTELAAAVDTGRSPLFNPDFIGGWNPAAGIDAHWTVSGIVNIVAHPAIGPTLLTAVALAIFTRSRDGARRDPLPRALALAGALYFTGLVYGLAVHPQPRMFLPLAAGAAALVGIGCDRMARSRGWPLPAAILSALAVMGLCIVSGARDLRVSDRLAARWIAAEGSATTDPTTARALTLVPGLAPAPARADPSRRIALGDHSCAAARRAHHLDPNWRLIREARIPSALEARLGRPPAPGGLTLCLWRQGPGEAPRA